MNVEHLPSVADSPNFEAGSFRDREGRVYYDGQRVLRCLSAKGLADWEVLSATKFFREAVASGKIVATRRVDDESLLPPDLLGRWVAVLEHERVPFVSYPYEWTFGMLRDAALLELELLEAALDEGMILKDASPYNVQWVGGQPTFIDVLSFERLEPGTPWAGYRQFCQMCLYPLFLQAYKGVPFRPWLRGSLDGIDAETCNRLMSRRDLFRRGVFSHVYLHSKLERAYCSRSKDVRRELRAAGFHTELIKANVRRLRKLVGSLTWNAHRSEWNEYSNFHSYTDADLEAKKAFVRGVAAERRRRLVWDLGCNIGAFSRIAAEHADCVVAMDGDSLSVEQLYQSLKTEGRTSILPLTVNLADLSPNLGWRGHERRDLPGRGKPELVLCLALLHHLVIGSNLPLSQVVEWLAELGCDLVVEFVEREDPMVKRLLCNKLDNYRDYNLEFFEDRLRESFIIARKERLASQMRILYYARPVSR
jgi:hypothetical protein